MAASMSVPFTVSGLPLRDVVGAAVRQIRAGQAEPATVRPARPAPMPVAGPSVPECPRLAAPLRGYCLMFRKPPSDRSDGYADDPVGQGKPDVLDLAVGPVAWGHGLRKGQEERRRPVPGSGYSRGRWQLDAHGFSRSSGDRLMTQAEMATLAPDVIFKAWRAESLSAIYDFEHHVRLAEDLDAIGRLPPTFMLLPPHSWHPDVWSDVTRMLTMNTLQAAKGREGHLCPLQFDIVDRAIAQLSLYVRADAPLVAWPRSVVLDAFAPPRSPVTE